MHLFENIVINNILTIHYCLKTFYRQENPSFCCLNDSQTLRVKVITVLNSLGCVNISFQLYNMLQVCLSCLLWKEIKVSF